MQTMALAEACSGRIIAVDTCDEYLEELRQRVRQASLADRVEVKHADMMKLGLPEASLDLIWCEGAAYVMGVSAALQAWRTFLRDTAYLAFSELVWLEENPAAAAAEFFRHEYPAMMSREAIEEKVREGGYELGR